MFFCLDAKEPKSPTGGRQSGLRIFSLKYAPQIGDSKKLAALKQSLNLESQFITHIS